MANRRKWRRINPQALTPQEERFCEHYAIHANGAAAYAHAYPISRKGTAQYRSEKGCHVLARVKVQARLAALLKQAAQAADAEFEIEAGRVLRELAAVAFFNAADYFDWGVRQEPRYDRCTGEPILDDYGKPAMLWRPYVYVKPAAELTRSQKAAVIRVRQFVNRSGKTRIELALGDKLEALGQLLRFVVLSDAERYPTKSRSASVGVRSSTIKAT